MSRRERDTRDSHGRRLHSRFDREPSPKKLKRDEKPEVNLTHSSHRHRNVAETTVHELKQRTVQNDSPLEAPPDSSALGLLNEKKGLERKGDKPLVAAQHSTDNREVPRLRSFYQHDDRSSTGQGGRNLSRRPIDHRRWNDRARDETNEQPKKDDRPQSHADEKMGVWRHDRFYEIESGPPPARKRPAFREKKLTSEPETVVAATGTDKTKFLTTREQPGLATAKREERGGFYPRLLDNPDRRERKVDGFYHRGETQRNIDVDQSRERNGGMRGRNDRFNIRHGERELNRIGSFDMEKWKHDLFDETNQSPPPKNEEEQIAKIEALLAS